MERHELPESASRLDEAIGLRYVASDADGVTLRLDPTAVALGSDDPVYVHGGALATCVDTAGWYAVSARSPGDWVAVDLRCDFLRLAGSAVHRVHARCARVGRTLATVDVTISPWEDDGRPAALGRVVFFRPPA